MEAHRLVKAEKHKVERLSASPSPTPEAYIDPGFHESHKQIVKDEENQHRKKDQVRKKEKNEQNSYLAPEKHS